MRKFIGTLLVVGALLGTTVLAGAQDDMMMAAAYNVNFGATPFAEGAGLAGVTGSAFVQGGDGYISIKLQPNGATLPEGSVLEGWVVDAGRNGGPGVTNVSAADQTFGAPFGDLAFDVLVGAAPYALSTGVLSADEMGDWVVSFHIANYNFSPYDAVVITLESDGNAGTGWDPRPGAPVFVADIAMGEAVDAVDFMSMMGDEMMGGDMMEPMGARETTLAATPLAANAGLEGLTGTGTFYSDGGSTVSITINLNGATLPEGTVLEGWVVDAGLFGGPGTTNANDGDEGFGTPFGDASFDAAVEAAPYALSTGALADNGDGTLTVTFHISGYNFQPYDAIVVTLESDGNADGFDPRPGTPVLAGEADMMM
ncbi:MAG: hypothetical protein IH587_02315 [Anaerolineae bacterium]|nr:hypothetical protein [Anaerolineae bacterium]